MDTNTTKAAMCSEPDRIAVVGLGYVGLPLGLRFAQAGLNVTGIDIDAAKVAAIRDGRSYLQHIAPAAIQEQTAAGRLAATTDFAPVATCRAVIICVPTPLGRHEEPDLSFVLRTGEAIAPYLRPGMLVVLESTSYPGTTEDALKEVLEQGSRLTAGKDFHLAFSPEREDPGRVDVQLAEIPKIVGGHTPACLTAATTLYRRAIKTVVPVSSCRVAEAAKLLENIFRCVNIALVNELKVVYAAMDINIWEVINAARTKPFGFMAFYPGPGLGGHCIPIDPFYLTWKAREYGQHTRFIELAGQINSAMPDYVVRRIATALNEAGKPLRGARILLLGLAYKPDVDDDRESPSYRLMEKLEGEGAIVAYHDPHIPVIRPSREYAHFQGRTSVEITDDFDALVLATAHGEYRNFDFSRFNSPLIDTRNWASRPPARYFFA